MIEKKNIVDEKSCFNDNKNKVTDASEDIRRKMILEKGLKRQKTQMLMTMLWPFHNIKHNFII